MPPDPQSTEERSAEFRAWQEQAQRAHNEHREALALNPNGGCFYLPRPMQVHSGLYWRCAHGKGFWARYCIGCLVRHPLRAFRWHFGRRHVH